jgi:hypothetical protein
MYRINKNDLRTFLLWLICSVLGIEVKIKYEPGGILISA